MKVVVLGGGESGVGAALLAQQKGSEVFLSDRGELAEKYKEVLLNNKIRFEEGQHTEEEIFSADVVVKSPGIPDTVPMILELKAKGIEVISEIEFASRFTKANIIGITGSNGKTTTTMLTYHLLKHGGLNVGIGGNIGDSFAKQLIEDCYDDYVLELSSFQLDGIERFRPHIAMIINITPDHLDRYGYKMENYIASKFRITKNQTEEDYFIYDADDEHISKWMSENEIKAKLLPFSLTQEFEEGAFLKEDKIEIRLNKDRFTMSIDKLALQGKHNVKNSMAATMAAQLLNIRKQTIRECLEDFEGAEHRLEKVLKINGVEYINDSKATNVNATYYALDSLTNQAIWIVGGVDKGNDYFELMPLVREKVKAVICLGKDNRKIIHTFENVVEYVVEADNMEDAVKLAYRVAEKGETVLLSPACASFDLFENYEDRGRKFKEAVRHL